MYKNELRSTIKEKTYTLNKEYKQTASDIITDKIISSDEFKNSGIIFIFISTDSEPDTKKIIQTAWEQEKIVCVPKCFEKGKMKAFKLNCFDELTKGKYGIPEPEAKNEITVNDIDLAIVPCLSASADGRRLGHGGGYYDRFLQNCKCKKICLCFKALTCQNIPMDEFDIYMDKVITD